MKKITILLLATAALFAACSEEEGVLPVSKTDSDAISFSAYTGETTKGVVEVNTEITEQDGTGIGVFAFYQPAVGGVKVDFNTRKFATPDFMYNQKVYNHVWTSGAEATWGYDPIKFWPNNTGDQLSFFAYAPYKEGTTWDDLGIATDATASKITASFPIYNEKLAMKDILWTDPQLNKTKASTATGATDNPIVFNFRHLLSKVAIYAGVEQNTATGNPTVWDDANTTITIDKIEFTGLADAYNYSCVIPMSGVTDKTVCWTPSTTTQDIVLTYSNGDFADASAVIDNSNYAESASDYIGSTRFKDLLAKESNESAFLFLAPQTFTDGNEQAIITYTVKTTASNSANSSTITNTIATDLYDILSSASNAFTTGKAYTLKFLLGMNSVKISASVTDWDAATEHQIDVPANDGPEVYVTGSNCSISNYSEDDTNVSFTLGSTNLFNKAYYATSTDGVTYSGNTEITISDGFAYSHDVSIAKSALTTKFISVTIANEPTLTLVAGDGITSIADASEDNNNIYFTVNSTSTFYKLSFQESSDGDNWTDNGNLTVNDLLTTTSAVTVVKSELSSGITHIKVTPTVATPVTSNTATISVDGENDNTLTFTISNSSQHINTASYQVYDGSSYGEAQNIDVTSYGFFNEQQVCINKTNWSNAQSILVTTSLTPSAAINNQGCTAAITDEDDTYIYIQATNVTVSSPYHFEVTTDNFGGTWTNLLQDSDEECKCVQTGNTEPFTFKYHKSSASPLTSFYVVAAAD